MALCFSNSDGTELYACIRMRRNYDIEIDDGLFIEF